MLVDLIKNPDSSLYYKNWMTQPWCVHNGSNSLSLTSSCASFKAGPLREDLNSPCGGFQGLIFPYPCSNATAILVLLLFLEKYSSAVMSAKPVKSKTKWFAWFYLFINSSLPTVIYRSYLPMHVGVCDCPKGVFFFICAYFSQV